MEVYEDFVGEGLEATPGIQVTRSKLSYRIQATRAERFWKKIRGLPDNDRAARGSPLARMESCTILITGMRTLSLYGSALWSRCMI